VVEVAKGGEEGTLLDLCLLEALLLERLLVESSLGLILVRGVLPLALAPTRVVVTWDSLLLDLLEATGDEVVGVATVEASILRLTMPLVLAIVVKSHEPIGHKRQILIPEALHLLLCDSQQRRQSKQSR
jgi:hypothetical protein